MSDEEYVAAGDIAEEVELDNDMEMEPEFDENEVENEVEIDGENDIENADLDDLDDTIEIDMSNNLWTYFDQHKDSVFTVFAHPSLPMVVSGGGDNTAYMWTTHTQPPRFVGELSGHSESVVAGAFSGDGLFVVTGDMDGYVQVHRSSKGGQKWSRIAQLHEVDELLWVCVHPRLPYFAFGAPDGLVWVYNVDGQSVEQQMLGFVHTMECNAGVFQDTPSEDVLLLVTVAEDGTVVQWNGYTGAVLHKWAHDDFRGVDSPWVLLKAHENVVAVGGRDGHLAVLNLATGKVVHHAKTMDKDDVAELLIEALAWGPGLLAVGLVSGDVLVFDAALWRLRRTIHVPDAVTRLEFVAGLPVLVALCMDGKIYQWDARTGAEGFVGVGHNMGVLDFAISQDKIVTAGDEGVCLVYKPE